MRQSVLRHFVLARSLALLFWLPWLTASPALAQVAINVDATANQHPINPLVYGVAFGSATQLNDLNAPLNRWGGNSTTRYNWQTNSHNTAADYYYESIGSGTPGLDADNFISDAKNNGAQPMMTIPIIDWIARAGPAHPYLCSYPTSVFPSQQFVDPFQTNCGNGKNPDGSLITNPIADPNTANLQNSTSIQTLWVQHLTGKWGMANAGGLQYYILDNEHSIWYGTHRDVHPNGPGMDELFQKMRDYSLAIKSAEPNAIVVGPEEWGWDGYFYSGKDQQLFGQGDFSTPDKVAHNNQFYIPWLLDQFHQYETANGKRLLDVLSVHYYPQGDASSGRQEFSNDDSAATQTLRNQSTRSLWDPTYVDKSWITSTGLGNVMLIPRLKTWVTQHYPGLKTAITEYNWGDEANMNGATTQADIYGIFGREGLDIGTRWTTPAATTPTYKSMKMYRNYDGLKSTFGDTSVSTTVPNPDHVSAFSALRSSDGALTVMLVNKDAASAQVNVSLAHFQAAGAAHVWQLSANAISHLSDISIVSNAISSTLPSQSVTLLVVPAPPPNGDFTVSVPVLTQTVLANQTAIFSGTLTATNGYSNSVTVTCGTGKPATCSSTTVTPTAGGAPFSITASNPTGGDFNFNLVATGSDPKAITHQQAVVLHVSDFSVAVSNSPQTVVEGQLATFSGTLTAINGYSNSVTVTCGAGAPATCNPATVTPTAGGATFSITATNLTGGDFTFNLIATGSDSQTITRQQPVTLHVSDFTIAGANPVQTVLTNQTATFNGTLTAVNGYNSSVTVSCGTGAPPTCPVASPVTPTAPGAAFSISASSNTTGDYSFSLVGTGSDASTTTRSQPVTLHVVSASADLAVTLGRVPSVSHVMVGTPLTYTATVTNNGPTTTTATVTFTFSRNVRTGTLPNGCTGTGPIQCTTAALSTGQNAAVPLTVIAPLTHDLKVTATVLSTTAADPDSSNNTAKDSVRVYLRPIRRAEDRGAP